MTMKKLICIINNFKIERQCYSGINGVPYNFPFISNSISTTVTFAPTAISLPPVILPNFDIRKF